MELNFSLLIMNQEESHLRRFMGESWVSLQYLLYLSQVKLCGLELPPGAVLINSARYIIIYICMIMVTSSSTVPVLWDTQNPYKTFYLVLNNHTFLQLVESNCKRNIFLCHLHLPQHDPQHISDTQAGQMLIPWDYQQMIFFNINYWFSHITLYQLILLSPWNNLIVWPFKG